MSKTVIMVTVPTTIGSTNQAIDVNRWVNDALKTEASKVGSRRVAVIIEVIPSE